MSLKPKKDPASIRDKCRALWMQDEYTDESIADALGITLRQLHKWRDEGDWPSVLNGIRIDVARRAAIHEANRRLRIPDEVDDKSGKLVEATIARFLRDRLGSGDKVTASDVRALVAAIEGLRKVKRPKPGG